MVVVQRIPCLLKELFTFFLDTSAILSSLNCRARNTDSDFYHDAMCKHGLCCRPVSVHLSVHPSVTFVYCIQMAEYIVKPLTRPAHHSSLKLTASADPHFQGQPLQRWRQIHQRCEKLRFTTVIAVYLRNGTRQAHDCYGTLTGCRGWRIDPCWFR